MAGKKGMKMRLNKDQSPRCIEYYVKNFPELSLEECEQKLKTFKRKGFTAVEWGGVIH